MLKLTIYTAPDVNPLDYTPGDPIDSATVESNNPVLFRAFQSDADAMQWAELMREETGQNIARIVTRD